MRRICVDMDEVMADTLAEFLRRYNEVFQENLTPADFIGRDPVREATPERRRQIHAIFDEEDFFEDLALIPHAQEVLEELSHSHEIFIATQAMVVPNSLGPKFRWLQRHFPFIPPDNYVFCGSKAILHADYLIDDRVHNLKHFVGTGLLYSAPHNAGVTGYIRVDDWLQVAEYFRQHPADA